MANFRLKEVLEAWDILVRFTTWERTLARTRWIRRSYEIGGSIEDWLENKFNNVIDEYSQLKGLSFDEAKAELETRPYGPPL